MSEDNYPTHVSRDKGLEDALRTVMEGLTSDAVDWVLVYRDSNHKAWVAHSDWNKSKRELVNHLFAVGGTISHHGFLGG